MPPRRATLLIFLILALLPMRASVPRAPRPGGSYTEAADLIQLRHQGNARMRAADYAGASRIYESGVEAARRRGDPRSALRFLNNVGGASFYLRRYRDAARAYLQVRNLAAAQGDPEMLAATAFNLSSVYFQLGDADAARESAERGLALPPGASAKFRASLLIQSAVLAASGGDCDGAARRLREAIEVSRDASAEAHAWNELGNTLLDCQRLGEAEDALLEGYRLRKLARDPLLHFSYESLAELRWAQQDPHAAAVLLDRAIEIARDLGPAALWRPLHARGRAKQALGHAEAAYVDFREALRNLKDWRAEVLPSDTFRVHSEVETHRVYAAFVEAAGARYRSTRDRRYAAEAFAAAEIGRAASLRALWTRSDGPRRLPDEYWATRNELHRAESEHVRGVADDSPVRRLRARLSEMEAAAGLELAPEADPDDADANRLIDLARGGLESDEVFIGFFAGERETAVWALTRNGLEMAAAPPESELQSRIAEFVAALRDRRPQTRALGRRLFTDLFGKLDPRVHSMSRWTVAPDGPLFDLPLSALVDGDRYLIERRSLRVTTGIPALLRPAATGSTGTFVGLGDPIYNRADPRRQPKTAGSAVLELPRLPGSGREIQACAKIWQSQEREAVLLDGASATKENLARALARGPAVVHLAAHMLFPERGTGGGMLALTMQSGSELELLSETEVAGMDAKTGLVALNGCSSGRGAVLPGAGLMGMTRAWLAAGARAVIATRWPAADQDAGTLFESLYRLYLERSRGGPPASFGALLREAQLAELRAGGARADASRWASYFCVETN
jgi:tetratricopeptide (TPR) repeat protein